MSFRHNPGDPLTQAEREVWALASAGLTNQEISEIRSTALATTKAQMMAVMAKLDASSRVRATIIYHNIGQDQIVRALREGGAL